MKKKLHCRLKEIRILKGLTQANIAEKLFISPKAYSKIENGETRIDIERLADICSTLEINLLSIIHETFVISSDQDQYNFSSINVEKVTSFSNKDEMKAMQSEIQFLRRALIRAIDSSEL